MLAIAVTTWSAAANDAAASEPAPLTQEELDGLLLHPWDVGEDYDVEPTPEELDAMTGPHESPPVTDEVLLKQGEVERRWAELEPELRAAGASKDELKEARARLKADVFLGVPFDMEVGQ